MPLIGALVRTPAISVVPSQVLLPLHVQEAVPLMAPVLPATASDIPVIEVVPPLSLKLPLQAAWVLVTVPTKTRVLSVATKLQAACRMV